MKSRSASKIKLTSYDDLLSGSVPSEDVREVAIEELYSFTDHPFKVKDDEEMKELVESVKTQGILTALLVRPLKKGGYEIISGHRRKHAAELAGLERVPVIVREMDKDSAVRAMVDSNLQREHILPSEKAFAYRMKMEAMNHQGISGGNSAKEVGKGSNDSARQVYRYIRLTYLMNTLLKAVDEDIIKLQVGVELSYLSHIDQELVEEVHDSTGKYPSLEQAKQLRKHREENTLTKEVVRLLIIGEPKKKTTITLKQDDIKKYFPPDYDEQKMRNIICQLLEEWSNQNH
jgi:ParB family chromosome partitioning protein